VNILSTKDSVLQKETFAMGVKISVAAHAFILAIVALKAVFIPDVELQPTENAIRVDLIALPDKYKPNDTPKTPLPDPTFEKEVSKPKVEPQPPPPASEVSANSSEKNDDSVNLNRIKQKQGDALKKLKAQSALEKIKEDLEKEDLKNLAKQNAASKLKGNIAANGNSLTGISKLQHDSYVSDLERSIKKNFYLAEWLRKKQLKTVVRIRFNNLGIIISHTIALASGNPSYDEAAIDAIERTAPFPSPPEKLIDYFESRGFDVEFTDNK